MAEVSTTTVPLVCELPMDLCKIVAEFKYPHEWFAQACVSEDHFLAIRDLIGRKLGVTQEEIDAVLHCVHPDQSDELVNKVEEWMISPDQRMILMSEDTFMVLGYPCMNNNHSPRYTGKVLMKPLDESYWPNNYENHGESFACPLQPIHDRLSPYLTLLNLKDLSSKKYHLQCELQKLNQHDSDTNLDPILRDFFTKGSLSASNDPSISVLHKDRSLMMIDKLTGQEMMRMTVPFRNFDEVKIECDGKYWAIEQTSPYQSWWIVDLESGQWTFLNSQMSFQWINRDLFTLFRSCESSLRCASNPTQDLFAGKLRWVEPMVLSLPDFTDVDENTLTLLFLCFLRRNLIRTQKGDIWALEWETQQSSQRIQTMESL